MPAGRLENAEELRTPEDATLLAMPSPRNCVWIFAGRNGHLRTGYLFPSFFNPNSSAARFRFVSAVGHSVA